MLFHMKVITSKICCNPLARKKEASSVIASDPELQVLLAF